MLAYVIVAGSSVMWPPATILAFHLKSSNLTWNTIWYPNVLAMGTYFQSGRTSNATLTFSIFLI